MNDNDIIKALECCINDNCKDCPFRSIPKAKGCAKRIDLALDLINRQKAEIERLKDMVEAAEDHYNPLPFKGIFDQKIAEAKNEAINEFAKRLEPKLANNKDISAVGYQSVIADIDSLVKETTEGKDA